MFPRDGYRSTDQTRPPPPIAATAAISRITGARHRSPWLVLASVMVGTLLVGLDRTVVNLAVPSIIGDFDITVSTAGWLATAYLISDSVFIPVFGKLGDMVGDRRVYTWGMWGFLATSVFCGLAWNFGVLVFFRVLQGLVGAAVFPTALSLITRTFSDPGQRTQAFGIWSASFAASIAMGPLIGGPLIDHLSWRWIFYINFPIALAGVWMARAWIPADRHAGRFRAFDWQGAVLLGIALAAAILVLDRGREWGWLSPGAIACYLTALGVGVFFLAFEHRNRDPVVDLVMFRNAVLTSSLVVSFVSFAAMVGCMFLLPVFAQQMLGYDATQSGLLLLPMAVTLMVVAPVGTKLTAGLPVRYTVAGGMAIAATAIFLLHDLDIKTGALELIVPLVILAVGLALGFAPLTSGATGSVPPRDIGMASGILNLTRNIGAAVGIALFASLLDTLTEGNVLDLAGGTVVDQPTARVMTALPGLIAAKARVDAFSEVFGIAALVMAFAALSALWLRSVRTSGAPAGEAGG